MKSGGERDKGGGGNVSPPPPTRLLKGRIQVGNRDDEARGIANQRPRFSTINRGGWYPPLDPHEESHQKRLTPTPLQKQYVLLRHYQ